MKPMGFVFQIGSQFGAGLTTLNLLSQLLFQGQIKPILLFQPAKLDLSLIQKLFVQKLLEIHDAFFKTLPETGNNLVHNVRFPVIACIGNGFTLAPFGRQFRGSSNLVKTVFEDTYFDKDALERSSAYDAIIPVSTWNKEVLEGAGFRRVYVVPQGIDPTLFHPAPRQGIWRNRFVIFSAGKMEFRKGQDIVIAAFKVFHERHPDSLLCFSWHNIWPETMIGIDALGYVKGVPEVTKDQIQFSDWLLKNGLPQGSFADLNFISHNHLPQVIRETDVALFPNRCEGGTNLLAMETMACGVPTVLSANTGHMDIISGDNCYALNDQRQVKINPGWKGVEGWGESSVEEIIDTLETIYHDREEALKRGTRGAEMIIKKRSWVQCAQRFTEVVQKFID